MLSELKFEPTIKAFTLYYIKETFISIKALLTLIFGKVAGLIEMASNFDQ